MTYINYRHNNDMHLTKTLAEFEVTTIAKIALRKYKLHYNPHNIYLSSRSTKEWRETKNI